MRTQANVLRRLSSSHNCCGVLPGPKIRRFSARPRRPGLCCGLSVALHLPRGDPEYWRRQRRHADRSKGKMTLPEPVRALCQLLLDRIRALTERIAALTTESKERASRDETAHRLMTIPTVSAEYVPTPCRPSRHRRTPSEPFRDVASWMCTHRAAFPDQLCPM